MGRRASEKQRAAEAGVVWPEDGPYIKWLGGWGCSSVIEFKI